MFKAYRPITRLSPIGASKPGRGINTGDERSLALVAVIGQTVYHQLFARGENLSAPR